MKRMSSVFVVLLSLALLASGHHVSAGGAKKDDKKDDTKAAKSDGDKRGARKHPHIERALSHLHEAREQVLNAIKAEEREKKVDATIHRELVHAMDQVNEAIAHARTALGLERREGKDKKK